TGAADPGANPQTIGNGPEFCAPAAAASSGGRTGVAEGWGTVGHGQVAQGAAASVSVFDGGQDHEDRRKQNHGSEECDGERAVFSGAFSESTDHARGAATGGDRAGGRRNDAAAGGELRETRLFHVGGERALAQTGASRGHDRDRGGADKI